MRYRVIWDAKGLKAEIENGEALFWREDEPVKESALPRPMVVRDIEPYQSMIDGRMVTSRSAHREHLKANNCIEIGNENPVVAKPQMKNTRREVISRRLGDMSDKQADKLLKSLKKGV